MAVLASAAAFGTLIHREPQGDIEPDEPWFAEAHWLVEDGKITGIRTLAKMTQDDAPTAMLTRFKVRGQQFEMVGEAVTVKPPRKVPRAYLYWDSVLIPAAGAPLSFILGRSSPSPWHSFLIRGLHSHAT